MLGYFVKHRLAANLLMMAMVIFGLLASAKMPTQLMPNVSIPFVEFESRWQGVNAQLMASDIINPLSESINQLSDVKDIYAYASNGYAWMGVEFNLSADMDKALPKLQKAVQQFNWPAEVDIPNVEQERIIEPVGMIILSSPGDINGLRAMAENAKKQLVNKGLASVDIWGLPNTDMHWKPDLKTWLNLNQNPAQVATLLASQTQKQGAGMAQGQSVEVGQEFDNARLFGQLQINNTPIQIISAVEDQSIGLAPLKVDGNPAVILNINRPESLGTIEAGKLISQWVEEFKQKEGDFVYISSFSDTADFVEGHLDLLVNNALLGLALVLFTLFILLNSRVAFWTAAGIPVAIIGTLGLLYLVDGSLNMFSIFALLIALGIVVDDAIVVSEETLTLKEQGMSASDAAINGVKRMFSPVMAAALTSIAAFSPLLFLPGAFGELLKPVPLVIICVLAASLFECFFILPGHLHHSLKKPNKKPPTKLRLKIDAGFDHLRETHFRNFIIWLTHHRAITVTSAVCLLVISIAMVNLNVVRFSPDLNVEFNVVDISVDFRDETSDEDQIQYAKMMTQSLEELMEQNPSLVKQHIYSQELKRNQLQYYVELVDRDAREFSNAQMIETWRENIVKTAIVENIRTSEDAQTGNRAGSGTETSIVSFSLFSNDIGNLKNAVNEIKSQLEGEVFLADISDNLPRKSFQFDIKANALARELGMDDAYIARQSSQWLIDQEVTEIARGDNNSKLKVGINSEDRKQLTLINGLPIQSPNGELYTLGQLTDQNRSIAVAGFNIRSGQINAVVSARITDEELAVTAASQELINRVIDPIASQYGVTSTLSGSGNEVKELIDSIKFSIPVALVLIYIVLAWIFQSWIWPFAVVIAIPFAITGSIFGHLVMGADFTFMSVLGIFGVAGIVINDSIILIDRFRQLLEQGIEKSQAIVDAACQRFRAVLLTSITTVIGLVPILFESSVEAQIVKTMAISLAFGLLYGTVVVLVITPAIMSFVRAKRFNKPSVEFNEKVNA